MNICITPESIKLFSVYFKKALPSQFTNDISAKALLNGLFNKAISDFKSVGVTDVKTRELVLQHLSIAPQIIKQYLGENPSAKNPNLSAAMNELSGTIYDASQSNVKSDFQDVINGIGQMIGNTTLVIPSAAPLVFNAITLDLLKTANQEMIYEEGVGYRNNVTDPEKQFEFDVQREIISSGNPSGIQLKLVKQSELENNDSISNTNIDTNPDAFVLVPIDSDGNLVKFDKTGKISEEGMTPVFLFKQNRADFNFYSKEKIQHYVSQNLSLNEAADLVNNEITGHLELLETLKEKHKTGKAAIFSISLTNSSMGFVEENLHNRTQMKEISNINDVEMNIEEYGTNWYPVINVPLSGKGATSKAYSLYANSLADITDEELDILTNLITNRDLKIKATRKSTGVIYESQLQSSKRQELIYFYHQKKEEFEYKNKLTKDETGWKDKRSYTMRIGNQIYDATPENATVIRQALKDYFTRKTSRAYTQSTKFTNMSPFESFDKTTGDGQVYLKEDGSYHETVMPRRNMNIQRTTDLESVIDIPTSIEGNVISASFKTVRQHIIDNTSTRVVPNSNNELRGYSSHLALGITAEGAAEVEEIEDDDPFFRTIAEINLETEPTEQQKEDALTWFKNHPLFSVLSVNFKNQIHEKGPSFVAEFVKSSVNLYLGSNNTDIYHEAFHAFTQSILTSAERKAMYSEVAKTPGSFKVTVLGKAKTVKFSEATELEMEEYLAEKFRDYSMNRGKSKLSVRVKQFFDKVLNMLKGMFGKNMTYNEAIALNKATGVVNNMFNALYEGNIDVSRFNPSATQTALYKSTEISVPVEEGKPEIDFSIEQVSVLMESMQSLMSDYINLGINANSNRTVNTKVNKLLIQSSKLPVGSEKHTAALAKIDALNKTKGVVNGYGIFAVSKNPQVLNAALTYIKNRLTQQRDLMKPLKDGGSDFAYDTLSKAIDAFGNIDSALVYLGAETHSNLLSLFLNNYNNIQITSEEVDYLDELDDSERLQEWTFGRTGTERSLADITDSQTKQLLSSIHAHENNGKGAIIVNSLGIKKMQPFANMLAKTSKLLRNTTDRVVMYNKLVEGAKKDYEIAQILMKLGDINNPAITTDEQMQWLNFWQVMNKADLFLREFIIEKQVKGDGEEVEKTATLQSRSGRTKSAASRVARDWEDNFVFVSQDGGYFTYDNATGISTLNVADVVEDYATIGYGLISGKGEPFITSMDQKKGSNVYTRKASTRASALPFEFLNKLGISLVEDPIILDILVNGHSGLGIGAGIIENIYKSMQNRSTAIYEKDKTINHLSELFTNFKYRDTLGEVQTQESLGGWFGQLQELQYMFSDENSSSMGLNAEGEAQSEKAFNSSLTVMVGALNDANSYTELMATPGMEMFDVDTNPFAAASPWLIDMFNLNSKIASQRGTRNKNFKITAESLSGSKVIYNTEDKGSVSISLDEKAKFISDFHLTLEGKQEIPRSEAKSTSLTVHAPIIKNGAVAKNELAFNKDDINLIYSADYEKNTGVTLLYDQFYRHLEAELVRISRLNDAMEDLRSENEIIFDAAYLERGRTFFMFANILTNGTKNKLLALNVSASESADIKNPGTLNNSIDKSLKGIIDLEIKNYFEKKADGLFKRKNARLTIADNALAEYRKNEEEEIDVTRKRMFRTFIVNNFLQTANYATLFIGDAALYKVNKEDYHKRISSLISSGKIFAVDKSFLAFVNNPNFRAFGFASKHNAELNPDINYSRPYTGYINTAVIKEAESVSVYLKHYTDIIKVNTDTYGSKEKMAEADAAGFISFDMYRLLNLSCGEWSIPQDILYNKMLNGDVVSEADITTTFPLRKFQYSGIVGNESASFGLQMMAFHKYSLIPLIPALIKGTPLEDLNNKMMEQGIDYTTFPTGSKLSSISKVTLKGNEPVAEFDNFYDESRNTNDVTFTVNKIHAKFLKNQIYLAPGYKKKVSLSTQKRKMIVNGLFDGAMIPEDYETKLSNKERTTKWNSLTESKKRASSKNYNWYKRYEVALSKMRTHLKNELIDDLGLTFKDGVYSGSPAKLVAYLEKEMQKNDMLPDDVAYIVSVSANAETLDFSLSMYSEKIEAILMTLADKKLRSIKVTGEKLTQVPGTMMENKKRAAEFAKLEKPTDAEIQAHGTNGLSFYHVTNEDGSPVLTDNGSWIVKKMQVKISMQGDFKKLFNLNHFDGKKIAVYSKDKAGKNVMDYDASLDRLNNAIRNDKWNKEHAQFLELTGDRIPVQFTNSLESITVAEFLPEWAGPIIILPSEIVAKAGSDYDIDALFTQFPNIVKIGNKIELQSYRTDVTESLEELYASLADFNDRINSVQSDIDELYEQRFTFWKQSVEISEDVKNKIQEQNNLDQDLYATRKELNGFLNAAQKGLWIYKDVSFSQRKPFIDSFTAQVESINQLIEHQENEIKRFMFEELGAELASDFYAYSDQWLSEKNNELKALNEPKEEIQRKIYGKSIKGIENELLSLFNERLTMPDNLKDLITANSTTDVLPLAKEIEKIIRKRDGDSRFNKYERVNDEPGDFISNTTIFDYEYNLLKHQENSVAINALGIAAVSATYYAIFTSFGAKLNAVSAKEQKSFDASIIVLENANKINQKIAEIKQKAGDKISLENQNEILSLQRSLPAGDKFKEAQSVVNKFKDHTFKLDHNKLESTLGTHIAVGMRNNTKGQSIGDLFGQLINGYVDVAKDAWIFNLQGTRENTPTLMFMVMAGVSIESAAYLSSMSLVMEYNQYKKELSGVYSSLDTDAETSPIVDNTQINKRAMKMLFENHEEFFKSLGYSSFNYASIANKNTKAFTQAELKKLVSSNAVNLRQLEALAEYVHIETIANDIGRFQQLTRFDTNKVSTLSEAQKRIEDTDKFKAQNNYTPQEWFGSEGIENSPIGQFNSDKFLVALFNRYFTLRNNPAIIDVSLTVPKQKGIVDTVMRTDFKNDFEWFLYQNSVFKKDVYDGYTLRKSSDPAAFEINEETKEVSFGADLLTNDMFNPALGLSNVRSLFSNFNQYVRFKIEFQKLDSLEMEELRKDYYFLDNSDNPYTDNYLKQKIALYKSRNHNSYFYGPTSVENMFKTFKQKNPDLIKKYALIRDMRFSRDKASKKSNMYLPDISDVELRKQYKENLQNLKNDPRPEIREFFGFFNHIAMMQTGLNRRSRYDLGKIIDADHLHNTIDNGIGIGVIIDELNQINENIKKAKLNNLNKKVAPVEADLQILGQFKELFEEMLTEKYRLRVRGYNYEVQSLAMGKSKTASETILSFNNVDIKSSLVGLPGNVLALTADMFYDEEGEFTPKQFAEGLVGEKIAILNKKLIVPDGESQAKFDKLILDYLGIDNSGQFPTLEYKSKTQKKGFLSVAGLGVELMPIHSIKDEAMANASTMAIGQATIVSPTARSSSQNYVDELTKNSPTKLAKAGTKFKSTDTVWVFGSGVFASRMKNVTPEQFQIALDNTFNSYHKPNIDKAIKAGVKTFNVGTAFGIDAMAVDYLEAQGYVKVPVYAAVGKYYEMRSANSSFEDLPFDVNAAAVTASSLNAKDMISYLFATDKADKWFDELSEKEIFEKGVAVVYDRIAKELIRNQSFKVAFLNELMRSKGQIVIGKSVLSTTIEQALYKMKKDVIAHKQGSSVKAPIVVTPLKFGMEIGSFVKYQGSTYIITQFNDNGTIQIYNPTLEGTNAKISVSKTNVETLSAQAKIVNYRNADYIVTPKGTIISLTTNKAMDWSENDGNRVAILNLIKDSSAQLSTNPEQLYSEYKGTIPKSDFLSLSLEEQTEIIEQQNKC
jgi:hypothetical protein